MLIDEHGFAWACVRTDHGPRGEQLAEYRCEQHPRLSQLVQRSNQDEPYVATFHITGLAQVYRSLDAALEALRSNPA